MNTLEVFRYERTQRPFAPRLTPAPAWPIA